MRSKIPVMSSHKQPLFARDMRRSHDMVQHNGTLFKWNLKEVSTQFAESGQLWVHAHFSEIFPIRKLRALSHK